MELIKSYNKSNAVKVVAFAIYFLDKLSDEDIIYIVEKIKNSQYFKKEFNNIGDQMEISMIVSQDGSHAQSQNISGATCNKTDDENLTWSVVVNKDVIVVTCNLYTRWGNISKQAYKYIDNVLSLFPNGCNIAHIALEYLDEFHIIDNNIKWKENLFQEHCNYLSSNVYSLDDFWHVNQGYFIKLPNLEQKLLDTVNINYFSDEEDNFQHKVNIRMQHKLSYSPEISYDKERTEKYFNIIHEHSKKIFEKIVNNKILGKFDRGEK